MKSTQSQQQVMRRGEAVTANHYVSGPVSPQQPYHETGKVETCPQQYSLVKKYVDGILVTRCEHREAYETHISCPVDTTLIENQCVRVTKIDVRYQCPEGFSRYGANQCIAHHECPIQTSCEDGILGDDGKCIIILRTTASVQCTEGSVLINGVCHRTSPTSPRISCPQGFNAVGIDCVKKMESDPALVCPNGTRNDLQNGVSVCVGAKIVEAELSCTQPGETLKMINGTMMCASKSTVTTSYKCPDGWSEETDPILGLVCYQKHTKKPDWYCDYSKGFRLIWNQQNRVYDCVGEQYATATDACPTGSVLTDGRCILTENFDQIQTCPKDYQELVGGKCQEVIYETLTTDCEGGNYDPINQICFTNVTAKPQLTCAPGCQQIPKTDKCLCETFAEAVNYCPSGCHMIDDRCEKDSIVVGKALCPENYGYAGAGICEHKEILESVRSCHDDDLIESGFCVALKETEPTLICPTGYVETVEGHCVLHAYFNLPHWIRRNR